MDILLSVSPLRHIHVSSVFCCIITDLYLYSIYCQVACEFAHAGSIKLYVTVHHNHHVSVDYIFIINLNLQSGSKRKFSNKCRHVKCKILCLWWRQNSCETREIKVPQKFYSIVALPTTAGQLILQKNQPVKLLKQHINECCLCLKEKGTAVSSVVSLFFSLPCQRQYRQTCCTSLITNWTNIQMNGHAPL